MNIESLSPEAIENYENIENVMKAAPFLVAQMDKFIKADRLSLQESVATTANMYGVKPHDIPVICTWWNNRESKNGIEGEGSIKTSKIINAVGVANDNQVYKGEVISLPRAFDAEIDRYDQESVSTLHLVALEDVYFPDIEREFMDTRYSKNHSFIWWLIKQKKAFKVLFVKQVYMNHEHEINMGIPRGTIHKASTI